MLPWLSRNPAVLRFRRIQMLSLLVRMTVLFVGVYLVLHYLKGA